MKITKILFNVKGAIRWKYWKQAPYLNIVQNSKHSDKFHIFGMSRRLPSSKCE